MHKNKPRPWAASCHANARRTAQCCGDLLPQHCNHDPLFVNVDTTTEELHRFVEEHPTRVVIEFDMLDRLREVLVFTYERATQSITLRSSSDEIRLVFEGDRVYVNVRQRKPATGLRFGRCVARMGHLTGAAQVSLLSAANRGIAGGHAPPHGDDRAFFGIRSDAARSPVRQLVGPL